MARNDTPRVGLTDNIGMMILPGIITDPRMSRYTVDGLLEHLSRMGC